MLRGKRINNNQVFTKLDSEENIIIDSLPIIDYTNLREVNVEEYIASVHLMLLNVYTNETTIYTDLFHLNSISHCYLEVEKGIPLTRLINKLSWNTSEQSLSSSFVIAGDISQDILETLEYSIGISFKHISSQEIQIKFHYQSEEVPSWLARQYFSHFSHLLNEIVRRGNQPLESINWNTNNDIKRIESACCGLKQNFDFQTKIDEMFLNAVNKHPNSVAVVGFEDLKEIKLTYEEVNNRVNGLAIELRNLGVAEKDSIAVRMNRGIGVIISLLAIVKVGGVYVPLDTTYPDEYANNIIEETGSKVVIVNSSSNGLTLNNTKVLNFNVSKEPQNTDVEIVNNSSTDDPCLIMYTSGSTGKPKGIVHSQKQIINRIYWMWNDYPFGRNDKIAQRSPINVMPSMWELIGGLLHGKTTFVIPEELKSNPIEFLDYLAEKEITYLTITPTIMKLFIDAAKNSKKIPFFKVIIVGGEFLEASLYKQFKETFSVSSIVNDFGATETNTIFHAIPQFNKYGELYTPFKPIVNVSAYVLDDKLQLLPFGIEGEIYVSGPNLAMKYVNLQEETSNQFHEWTNSKGEIVRLYSTGDMGYLLPDGSFTITGRKNHQLKINGMKVELTEVERTISQLKEVSDCLVIDRKMSTGKITLEAFIVKVDEKISAIDLIKKASRYLPSYMVPKRIEFVNEIEKLPNGKKNRTLYKQENKIDQPQHTNSTQLSYIAMEVTQIVAEILESDRKHINPVEEFTYIGFDSISIIQLADKITENFSLNVTVAELFNHPTIKKLAEYILHSQSPSQKKKMDHITDNSKERETEGNHQHVAIVGMSGKFPGAKDIDEFWSNLCNGACSITEIPIKKWDSTEYYDPNPTKEGKSYSKWGGFLEDTDAFDPLFFNISPEDTVTMDPQQRICLMESYKALEDAGYSSKSLENKEVGVFIGARQGDYKELIREKRLPPDSNIVMGNDLSLLAARISYFHNFNGPSLVVDTACSSSLTALHLACQTLKASEADVALVGGISITNDPDFYVGTSKMNIFSPTGECRAFDNNADGFVHGEGAAFVVLKPLDKAIQDNDHIYSVVLGTAMNQDGRSNGITAPNGEMQTKLQTSLYKKLEINPASIGYIEAHGTGTKLGDHIELTSLVNSYKRYTDDKQTCAIGSVKPNVGHLTAAAGITGLIKSVLCLYKRELVPSIHYNEPNNLVDLNESPFYVNTNWKPWNSEKGEPLRAAINSFGIGGTNVHCVVEEPGKVSKIAKHSNPFYLIPISAKTDESLQKLLTSYKKWINTFKTNVSIADLSYTLLRGRVVYPKGWVFIVRSIEDLEDKLLTLSENNFDSFTIEQLENNDYGITNQEKKQLYQNNIDENEYKSLLKKFATGLVRNNSVELDKLFISDNVKSIPAPKYVFKSDKYWINTGLSNQYISNDEEKSRQVLNSPGLTTFDKVKLVLSELLGIGEIEPNAELDLYGYTSVKAIDFKYRLETQFNIEISTPGLIQHNTLKEISEFVEGFLEENTTNSLSTAELDSSEINIDDMTKSELNELLTILQAEK